MNDKLYRLETLAPFDVQGIEDHLSRMAARGWHLESAGYLLWRYRRGEPARVRYAVACAPEEPNGEDLRDSLFFRELCEAAGWKRVTDLYHNRSYARSAGRLQIFRNEAANPVPLETDEALRLKNIHRAMRRTYLRCGWWQLLLAMLSMLLTARQLWKMPRAVLLYGNNPLFHLLFFLAFLLSAVLRNASYYVWYFRSRRSVWEGGKPAPVSRAYRVLWGLNVGLLALILLFLVPGQTGPPLLLRVAFLTLGVLGFLLLPEYMNRRDVDQSARLAAMLLCGILVILAFTHEPRFPTTFLPEEPEGTYRWQNAFWDEAPQPFPLTLEDLTGQSWPHVRRTREDRGSFLARELSFSERAAQEDGQESTLHYSLIRTDYPWAYDLLKADFLGVSGQWEYRREDPVPPGAEAAYRLYLDGVPQEDWLILGPGYLFTMDTSLSLPPEEMAQIAGALVPELEKEEAP